MVIDWSADTYNLVNFWLAVIGILLTVIGFGIAIRQINKTKTAAEAAATAASVGTKRIRYNQLIVLAPQLAALEPEMDSAVSRNDRFAAERALVRWRQIAMQAASILRELDAKYEEVAELIEKACGAARNAKARLPETDSGSGGAGGKSVESVTSAVRKDLAVASDRLAGVVSNLATEVDGGPTND